MDGKQQDRQDVTSVNAGSSLSMSRIAALALLALSGVAGAADPIRVLIVGDSAASEFGAEQAPREGWGQRLQEFLDPAALHVENHARSGTSARNFVEQGWLDPVASRLRPGDVLLIQFGHDDALADPVRQVESLREFPRHLLRYVELARDQQATPILITPLARRSFDPGRVPGQLPDTPDAHALAVRELAVREHVALVDLNAMSGDWLRALGEAASRAYYVQAPGLQQSGGIRLQRRGAYAVACMVVRGWLQVDAGLADHVPRDTDCGVKDTVLADLAAQPHPSLIVREEQIGVAQPGPHGGAGETMGFSFFADAPGMHLVLRKRVLAPGSGIGLHQHDHDEIYYVISGRGIYTLDGKDYEVGPGQAMLTRTGSSHAIRQAGEAELVLMLTY